MESSSNENQKNKFVCQSKILNFLNNNHSWILGLATIIITIVYGLWGLDLSRQQAKLTNIVYYSTELGDMNRLSNRLHQLQREHISLINFGFEPSVEHLKVYYRRLEKMNSLLISEMDNLYLNNNDTIHQLWLHTYANIGNFSQQLEWNLMDVGNTLYNPDSGSYSIIQVDTALITKMYKKFNGEVFTSIGALTGFAFKKIEQEKIKRGILDKNGKSKINPLDFYK